MSQSDYLRESDTLGLLPELLAHFGQRSQLDFDIEFFDRVLQRHGAYLDVLRCQGQLLSRKRLYARALEIDRRVVELAPKDAIAHYNLACSLALMGLHPEAIQSLKRALDCGYKDLEYLENDRDLDSLRNEPAYRELLREALGGQ